MANHFKIIVPTYNNEKWIKICINSVKKQQYSNFQCIIVDDCSTDRSVEIIKETIKTDKRFVLVENKTRQKALKNIYEAIELSNPNEQDIIITLDGDDFLFGDLVLSKVNLAYLENKCWMTYGSYAEFPSNKRGKFSQKIPARIIENNSFRENLWMSSHMRTFKFHLWNSIEKKDLMDNDRFCDGAWDMSFMFPMLEMSGYRSFFIEDILYIYNRSNPINEDKVNHEKLLKSEKNIRKMKKYKRRE